MHQPGFYWIKDHNGENEDWEPAQYCINTEWKILGANDDENISGQDPISKVVNETCDIDWDHPIVRL